MTSSMPSIYDCILVFQAGLISTTKELNNMVTTSFSSQCFKTLFHGIRQDMSCTKYSTHTRWQFRKLIMAFSVVNNSGNDVLLYHFKHNSRKSILILSSCFPNRITNKTQSQASSQHFLTLYKQSSNGEKI